MRNAAVYEAKRVVVATGVSEPYIPEIPGIEMRASTPPTSAC
jgi:cation diffusion facilitator CzcD-associated flavoprotein CzcO